MNELNKKMDTSVPKQPLKVLEIPLSKFVEEVIPHYQNKYDKEKVLIHKLLTDENTKEMHKELIVMEKAIMQLRDLMYELDGLKSQVEDKDAEKFDNKTLNLRKAIVTMVRGYSDLSRTCRNKLEKDENYIEESENPFDGVGQIQIKANLDDLKLREYNETCARVEALQEDVNDIHVIFGHLDEMIHVQGETIQEVNEAVESTANNVSSGMKHLQVAHRLKTTAYPMTGAVIGGMLGGPIGVVAGAKVGGTAALCCALIGYLGGKVFKNANEEVIAQCTTQVEEKKDI